MKKVFLLLLSFALFACFITACGDESRLDSVLAKYEETTQLYVSHLPAASSQSSTAALDAYSALGERLNGHGSTLAEKSETLTNDELLAIETDIASVKAEIESLYPAESETAK